MMNLKVTDEAAKWYKEEMSLEPGDYIQYYVQLYGGIPTAHPNYSLGMSIGKEGNIAVKNEVEGIIFYFNEEQAWFLDEFDMEVDLEDGDLVLYFEEQ